MFPAMLKINKEVYVLMSRRFLFFMRKIILAMFVSLVFFILFSCGDGKMPDDDTQVSNALVVRAKKVTNSEDVDFDYEHVRGFKIYFLGGVRDGQLTLYSNETASADTDFASLPFEGFAIDECGYDIKWYWRPTDSWRGVPKYFDFNRNVDFTKLGTVAITYSSAGPKNLPSYAHFEITLVDKDGNETERDKDVYASLKLMKRY